MIQHLVSQLNGGSRLIRTLTYEAAKWTTSGSTHSLTLTPKRSQQQFSFGWTYLQIILRARLDCPRVQSLSSFAQFLSQIHLVLLFDSLLRKWFSLISTSIQRDRFCSIAVLFLLECNVIKLCFIKTKRIETRREPIDAGYRHLLNRFSKPPMQLGQVIRVLMFESDRFASLAWKWKKKTRRIPCVQH